MSKAKKAADSVKTKKGGVKMKKGGVKSPYKMAGRQCQNENRRPIHELFFFTVGVDPFLSYIWKRKRICWRIQENCGDNLSFRTIQYQAAVQMDGRVCAGTY